MSSMHHSYQGNKKIQNQLYCTHIHKTRLFLIAINYLLTVTMINYELIANYQLWSNKAKYTQLRSTNITNT